MKQQPFFSLISIISLFISIYGCQSINTNPYKQGEFMYKEHCSGCHGNNGEGFKELYPPLAGSDFLKNQDALPCLIRHGYKGEMTVNGILYNQEMPANRINEIQITNIINYINHSWGNNYPEVSLNDIKIKLNTCPIEPVFN
jgi:mono/diheme cytochrome c family protein